MKSLYESLLGDLEDNMKAGDDYAKSIENEFTDLRKKIGTLKSYNKLSPLIFKKGYVIDLYLPNFLKLLGYEANNLMISFYVLDYFTDAAGDWSLTIELSKVDEKTKTEIESANSIYSSYVNIDHDVISDPHEITSMLKKAAKTQKSFKKFLDNMKKHFGESITPSNLL